MRLVSRQDFFFRAPASTLLLSVSNEPPAAPSISLPLQFLPKGGGLVVPVVLQDSFRYFAVVDTGSPFLTGPGDIIDFTSPSNYPTTNEQYGETTGDVQWRIASSLHLQGSVFEDIVVGVSAFDLVEETGGLFLGLMAQDDRRPTALSQLGYSSFVVDYQKKNLLLTNTHLNPKGALPMYDLTPFGPNLHHYAISCTRVQFVAPGGKKIRVNNPQRDIVVVIDTGLTGCVFSESCKEDFPHDFVSSMDGVKLTLGNGFVLESNPTYWFPSCFQLPWFASDVNHPHIIAVGASFLSRLRITIDSKFRRVLLEKM